MKKVTVGELLESLKLYNEESVVKVFGEHENFSTIKENEKSYEGVVFMMGGMLVIEKVASEK